MEEEFRLGKEFLVCGYRGLEEVRPTSKEPKLELQIMLTKRELENK